MNGQNPFLFDSELPGPQPITQPITGGGGGGLLDVLGGIVSAVPYFAAGLQAAQGNPEYLKSLQERDRQANLLEQLRTFSEQPEAVPYKEAIQQRLQLGDVEGAQKLVTDLPRQSRFAEMVNANPNLTDEQKAGIIAQGQISLSEGLKSLNEELGLQRREQFRMSADQRAEQRKQELEQRKRNPLNILTEAVDEGVLNKDSTQEEITGVLLSRQARLPANDKQRATQIKQLLESPQLKTLFPNANLTWWEKIFGASEKKTTAPATQTTAQPVAKTIKLKSASGAVREVADTPANRALAKQKNMQIVQ